MALNKKILHEKSDRIDEETLKLDFPRVEKILLLLDKSINIMKIFSFQHENVKNFVDQTFNSLKEFLEDHLMLDLEVDEFSFKYEGEIVFADNQIDKSLPYLFFKDGTLNLFIKRAVSREEFDKFLEVILTNAVLPSEEGDIVFSIWEKDFINIDYLATDEFLAAKIGVGMDSLKYEMDPDSLVSGSVELNPKDKQKETDNNLPESKATRKALIRKLNEPFDEGSIKTDLSETEVIALENMIESHREMSSQDEQVALYIELLYLDQRPENFLATVIALGNLLEDFIKRGDFERASMAMDSIGEIRKALIEKKGDSLSVLKGFYENIRKPDFLNSIKKAFYLIDIFQYDYFLSCLTHIGPASLPMVVDLCDENKDEVFLIKVSDFLKNIGREDATALMNIISENRPELTKHAISALGSSHDPKAVQYLSRLVKSSDSSVKKEAINALGDCPDSASAMALLSLLSGKDENIRILAAQNLNLFSDDAVVIKFMRIIRDKSFQKKGPLEKRILLELLKDIQVPETMKVFQSFIKKPRFFFSSKQIQTSKIVAAVLKGFSSEEARRILESGTRLRNRKIRKACQDALSLPVE